MKLCVVKNGVGNLVAADAATQEAVRQLAVGELYSVDLVRPRNARFHRLFFALLRVVHDNMCDAMQHKWPTVDRLLWELKLQTGYFDLAKSVGGKMYPIPQSISFAKMDESEFEEFYSKAITVVQKYFIPGIEERALREAVAEEVAGHHAD